MQNKKSIVNGRDLLYHLETLFSVKWCSQ